MFTEAGSCWNMDQNVPRDGWVITSCEITHSVLEKKTVDVERRWKKAEFNKDKLGFGILQKVILWLKNFSLDSLPNSHQQQLQSPLSATREIPTDSAGDGKNTKKGKYGENL